jgi:N,N-dimethylformamidase
LSRVSGYASAQSVIPGRNIDFMVSVRGGGDYRAELVRLHSPMVGHGPDVPEFREVELPAGLAGDLSVEASVLHHTEEQPLRAGSSAMLIERGPVVPGATLTVVFRLFPTLITAGRQSIIGNWSDGCGFEVSMAAGTSALSVLVGHGTGSAPTEIVGPTLTLGQWVAVAVVVDGATGTAACIAEGVEDRYDRMPRQETSGRLAARVDLGAAGLHLAARLDGSDDYGPITSRHFNGRIERPRIWSAVLDRDRISAELARTTGTIASLAPAPVGDWAFELDIPSATVIDRGPLRHRSRLLNLPTRAVRSSGWSGTHLDWRQAPADYAAIHFHDDDVHEAGWRANHSWVVPEDLASGCYALRLRSGDDEWHVPFFVRAPRERPGADVVLLISTATYAAYANMHLRLVARFNELIHGRLTVLDRTDLLLLEEPGLGKSTYDAHTDGSPVVYSSLRRPVTNFRPKGRIYKFCQDLLFVDWFEQAGIAFDVVTDEDLHREGTAAIDGYRVVVTSSHPEYHSARMLDTLEGFVNDGGRLAYLGGNGFWWYSEYHPTIEGVVEVRRPSGGSLWASGASERFLSFTGEPGGLWNELGRSPQSVCGVGFITQGFDRCSYYRRTEASQDPRAAFIFDGVAEDVIGDFGLLQQGAAGYEIDVFDIGLGSPVHGLVVASSEQHSNLYTIMTSSVLDAVPDPRSDAPSPIRADMVFFETQGGGAVFSVGSIAWSGSLAHAGYDNNVARITENVVRRFADPEPFVMPDTGLEGPVRA